jgi:hypothetical protein
MPELCPGPHYIEHCIMATTLSYLAELELSLADIQHLSNEEQRRKIRQQWLTLCPRRHPDQNPQDPMAGEKFQRLREAYVALKNGLDGVVNEGVGYQTEIERYFIRENINIPDTAFDLLLEENIASAYADLIKIFSTLQTENEKRLFGAYYAPFLNLGLSLENRQEELNDNRINHLFAQQNETFLTSFAREWRKLIIRLYGEEYLDDFQYRHALAGGDLYPILATRKLLSPLKAMVTILNSINIFLQTLASHITQFIIPKVMMDFMAQFHHYMQGTLHIKNAGIVSLEIIALVVAISAPFYLFPTASMLAFSIPMIATLAELIASPINNIVRPLAAYINAPPVEFGALLSIAGAAMAYSLFSSLTLTNLPAVLAYLSLPLNIYSLYGFVELHVNMYNLSPELGIFQGTMTATSILVGMLMPMDLGPDPSNSPIVSVSMFLLSLATSSMLYHANNLLRNAKSGVSEIIESLPLPAELPVPEAIQKATLLGNKRATQSHRFFNTPQNAEFIKANERTAWQQTCSFFGGGERQRNASFQAAPAWVPALTM